MNITKTLSVVIPCYNAEDYIDRCLQSVLQSGHDYMNFMEVIVVNDGSTDRTSCVLDKYNRGGVKIITTPNGGVSAARNCGLDAAIGNFVWFVDADDEVLECAIPAIFQSLNDNNLENIVFNFNWIQDDAKPLSAETQPLSIGVMYFNRMLDKIVSPLLGLSQIDIDRFFRGEFIWNRDADGLNFLNLGVVWQYVFSREFLINNNLRFRKGVAIGEDKMFICSAICLMEKIKVIYNPLYNYYSRSSGSLRTVLANPDSLLDNKIMLIEYKEQIRDMFLLKHNVDLSRKYDGSAMMSAMQLCSVFAKTSYRRGLNKFLSYVSIPAVRRGVRGINTSKAPLKYKIPIKILQLGMFRTLYTVVFLAYRLRLMPNF